MMMRLCWGWSRSWCGIMMMMIARSRQRQRQQNNFMLCSICTCTMLLPHSPLSLLPPAFLLLFSNLSTPRYHSPSRSFPSLSPPHTHLKWLFHVLHNFASLCWLQLTLDLSTLHSLIKCFTNLLFSCTSSPSLIPSSSPPWHAYAERELMLSYLSGTSSSRVSSCSRSAPTCMWIYAINWDMVREREREIERAACLPLPTPNWL